MREKTDVLIVEPDKGRAGLYARNVAARLVAGGKPPGEFTQTDSPAEALEMLAHRGFALIVFQGAEYGHFRGKEVLMAAARRA